MRYPELNFLQTDRCDKVVFCCFRRIPITQISNLATR